MNTLKASWEITAGLIIGEPMAEHTKVLTYTSEMYESDKTGETQHYYEKLAMAHEYARILSNPGMVNWVDVKFIWL